MAIENLESLLTAVGSCDDDIVAVVQTSDGAYAIRFEDLDVLAEWDASREHLMLSATIGVPPEERAFRIYEVLLAYNMAWETTGGIRMGLNGPGGPIVQLVDLFGSELTPRQIAIVASNLAERTRIWQSFFDYDMESELEDPAAMSSALTMLRV